MPRPLRTVIASLLTALGLCLNGACQEEVIEPTRTCTASAEAARLERIDSGVRVYLEAPDDSRTSFLVIDLERYLAEMWGTAVTVELGRPPDASTPAIWLTTSVDAKPPTANDDGYTIRRDGSVITVWAAEPQILVYGGYALLEELGARFFHPAEEVVPRWGAPHFPTTLDVARRPAFELRGIQMHTLHPIEAYGSLNEPGEQSLAEAQRLVDWVVKTGHNQLQWWLMGGVDDYRALAPHLAAIQAYAEARGVKVGAIVQTFQASSLQNAFALVGDIDQGEADIDEKLAVLMEVPWDMLELTLGEFLANDPARVVELLDHATERLAEIAPDTRISVVNHVGNYEDLYVDYGGQETYFYHLPRYADPRLVNAIHTVFFFDLYRPWGGYGHEDFRFQRQFLFEEARERTVRYIPESAYWASADIDVPIFLPSYLTARQIDVSGIVAEQAELGTPPVEGHILFSSGHEWGYWLTDYLTGRMLWQPELSVAEHLAQLGMGLGSCGADVAEALDALRTTQDRFLFDERLVGYLSGEDYADDFGASTGFVTTPPRVPFEVVYAMPEDERLAFEASVVERLEAYANAAHEPEKALRASCGSVEPLLGTFCAELADGAEVTRLRALHAAALYRAVLSAARGSSPQASLREAAAHREAAAAVIARREKGFRYDRARLVDPRPNQTIYDWGYLRQASTQCYWLRQEDQAQAVIETGAPIGFFLLRTCAD